MQEEQYPELVLQIDFAKKQVQNFTIQNFTLDYLKVTVVSSALAMTVTSALEGKPVSTWEDLIVAWNDMPIGEKPSFKCQKKGRNLVWIFQQARWILE